MTEERWVPFDKDAYVREVTSGRECFICRLIRQPDAEHPVLYQDEHHIAFLNRWPTLRGYTLVAPLEHREQVVTDFPLSEYLALQELIHRVGQGLMAALPVERIYILSLGSQAANSHVHWHLAPLPPGVPFEQQQYAALMTETKGYLEMTADERAVLAARIRQAIPPSS